MSGYIIYHYNILDKERINELGPLSLPILEKYGGELVVGSSVTRLEGSPYTHMVVYKFDSKEKAGFLRVRRKQGIVQTKE